MNKFERKLLYTIGRAVASRMLDGRQAQAIDRAIRDCDAHEKDKADKKEARRKRLEADERRGDF